MIELRAFDYAHDGVALQGQLALPVGAGPHPGVLVMGNAHGLGAQPKRSALALAELGYAALATDMYGDGGYFPTRESCSGPMMALENAPDVRRARIIATLEAFRALPDIDGNRIAAIGYCFGGQCALELARSGADVKCVVSYHGLLHTHKKAEHGAINGEIAVFTGARDPYVPAAAVEALRAELTDAGARHQITVFSEGYHAFTDPEAVGQAEALGREYDPLLRNISWASTVALLESTLGTTAAAEPTAELVH